MKKICIVILSLLLVGMFGFGNDSLPKETVQKVSVILEEAVKETRSADPDEQKVHQVRNLTYIATLYGKAGLHDHAEELIALAIGVTQRCTPCIRLHVQKCLQAGATGEQILEAASVAVMMGGGPAYTHIPVVMSALEALQDS